MAVKILAMQKACSGIKDGRSMAERLNFDELFTFKELLMSNEFYMEALVQLLLEKEVFTKAELS